MEHLLDLELQIFMVQVGAVGVGYCLQETPLQETVVVLVVLAVVAEVLEQLAALVVVVATE